MLRKTVLLFGILGLVCGCSSSKRASLTVFAAASLTGALRDVQTMQHVTYNFAGSQVLVTQISQGAPADVIVTADMTTMQRLVTLGLVDPPRVLVRNRLEILVAAGNPRQVRGLADLTRSDLKVVLADISVPAGKYAQQVLDHAGLRVAPVSRELDVESAVAKVTLGEADAAIVYTTDVKAAGARAAGVGIPDVQNVIASYPVAVIKVGSHHAEAQLYADELLSTRSQQVLQARGFLPAGG